ncbi:hypothetical protein [Bradyrhizobium diazoefficiens]
MLAFKFELVGVERELGGPIRKPKWKIAAVDREGSSYAPNHIGIALCRYRSANELVELARKPAVPGAIGIVAKKHERPGDLR